MEAQSYRRGTSSGSPRPSRPSFRTSRPSRPSRMTGMRHPRPEGRTESPQPSKGGEKKLKVIVVGGCEEVGRNMTLLEYGEDIILIDAGLQWPEEDMPGVDYIIPNLTYLKGKEDRVRGLIITHGHYDHIGAIPHVAPQLRYPIIYGTPLTLGLIAKRQEDYKSVGKLTLKEVDNKSVLKLGTHFVIEFFGVSHNIPGSLGIIVRTPEGVIVHTGDFKLDLQPSGDTPADIGKIAALNQQKVLALLSDSTNASITGHQLAEREIITNVDEIFSNAKGRLIIGTFASLLGRLRQIIEVAEKYNRKVAVLGFSMQSNIEIAQRLGYMKISKGMLIPVEETKHYPNNRIVILCTGAQGEERAALMRIANREHRQVRIEPNDTIVFSSSVIPGNERSVQRLTDSLYREGADVINYKMMDVHAGGHARQEDLKLMISLVSPKYLVPIEGHHSFLKHHAKAAMAIGFPKENIFIPDNGQVMEFSKGEGRLTNDRIPSDYVFVDGLGVGDVSDVILRDRQMMASDGMLVIIATIESRTGKLIGSPDIISRGFVHMKNSKKLIDETREKVRKILKDQNPQSSANEAYIRTKIRDDVGQFLYTRTERRPMILPVVVEV